MKKALSLLLVLAMVISMAPAVFAAPVVTISDDVTVKEGEVASFTVTTTGTGNISYVWYYRENSAKGWKFANETGKNSPTLMVTASRANNGYQYCCVVTDANGKTTSAHATLNVEVEPLAVIDQTHELTVSSGDTFSLKVKANDPNVKYRWYGRGYGNEYWRFPAGQGVVSDTLTATATGLYAKYEYMCRITDKNGNYVDSEIITVNISDPEELAFTKQPTDVSAKVGDQVTFYVYTTGAVRLQWYYKTATSNWAFVEKCPGYVSGNDTYKLTMDVTENNIGYQFTCQITGSDGVSKLTAETATLTLRDDLAIVTGPQDVTAEAGETVQFTIDAKGVSKYQWYRRTSATANWGFASEADGAKTSTLNVTATESMDGYQYCCVIQDVDGLKITSDPATLTVGYPLGHINNPHMINVMGVPYECQTGEVAAGATYYASINNGFSAPNMVIENANVNVIYKGETYAPVDGVVTVPLAPCYRMPNNVEIVNKGTEAASYTLKFEYPLGSMENPEIVTDLTFFYAPQAEGDTDGYYFKWTAPEAAILTLSLSNYAEGADYNAYVTVGYTQYNWAVEAVEGVLTIEVAEGDEVIINAFTISQYKIDENWNVVCDEEGNPIVVYNPESSVYINGGFVNGGINYPYDLSPMDVPGSAVTNVIEAGASEYYTTTASGTVITFNTQDITVEYEGVVYEAQNGAVSFYVEGGFDPMTRMPKPIVFKVTNIGTAAASFTANYNFKVGHSLNPDALILGDNTQTFVQGDEEYVYTWTATDDGELTISVSGTNGWVYFVNNLTDNQYSERMVSTDEGAETLTIQVEAGDEIQVKMCSYDADLWGSCDGSVTVNASFKVPAGEDAPGDTDIEQPIPDEDKPEDGVGD